MARFFHETGPSFHLGARVRIDPCRATDVGAVDVIVRRTMKANSIKKLAFEVGEGNLYEALVKAIELEDPLDF